MSSQPAGTTKEPNASIIVTVRDAGGDHSAIAGALIGLYHASGSDDDHAVDLSQLLAQMPVQTKLTDAQGIAPFTGLLPKHYFVAYLHHPWTEPLRVEARAGCSEHICLEPAADISVTTEFQSNDCQPLGCRPPQQNDIALTRVNHGPRARAIFAPARGSFRLGGGTPTQAIFSKPLTNEGRNDLSMIVRLPLLEGANTAGAAGTVAEIRAGGEVEVAPRVPSPVSGNLGVSLTRTETEVTEDLSLWVAIRNGTEALSFNNYLRFMDLLFCTDEPDGQPGFNAIAAARNRTLKRKRFLPFTDTDAYRALKVATEAFVMVNCAVLRPPGVFDQRADNDYLDRRDLPPVRNFQAGFNDYLELIGSDRVLPYLALVRRKLPDIPFTDFNQDEANLCVGFVQDKLVNPCLVELIWSYWNEEGMLVQTMNAVTRRFQNVRSPITPDPLANLEIDPLRPLNNLIWGYTQDEQHRLTMNRRNLEYDHHYGLSLQGKAVRSFRPADSRSQFLEAFHHLLRLCTTFFKQDDDTTIKADAFPVLNALKEVHLVMSQGAHNQFGDLPSTARIEMLMQQWLLGRPEFREFLPTRLMVAYPEPWMDRVDAMKKLQGWTDTSVVHFRNLAIFGEQLLLTIRYGAWSEIFEPTQAFNWARFWRPQIQGYIHAYRAATGIDLGGGTGNTAADATLPSLLLQRRLTAQRRSA